MRWDEIYDKSKAIVRQVIGQVLDEESQGNFEGMENIVKHLQDSDYLVGELKKRERYDYQEAFRNLKQGERRRNRLRMLTITSSAACILVAASLLVCQWDKQDKRQARLAENKMMPVRGMKAVLLKASGDELQLDERSLRVEGDNGVVMAVDSSGLQYEIITDLSVRELEYNTLSVPRGGVYQLTLADGTKVWLNSASRLIYPVVFSGNTREVTLVGEAYFDVQRDEMKPFIVKTSLGRVKVLGTRFNVKVYPEEASVITTLVDGSVSFGNEEVMETKLLPGYQLVYGKGDSIVSVRAVNVNNYVGWRDNQLCFHEETLEDIMRVLARWYDVEVIFEDEGLRQIEFSGNLDKYENISKFFKLFELGADVQFVIDNKMIRIRKKK